MSMEFTLNDLQRRRVEDHLALVEQVLRRSIKTNETVDGMGHDDLYQEGCIALCRAAVSYREEMGAFPAYARTVIRNYLLDRCREIQSARKNLPLLSLDAFAEMGAPEPVSPFHTEDLISDVSSDALLSHFRNRYHGTARLGIEALELRVRGYSCADIAKLYQKKPNYIGACISRAAGKLRRERIVREFYTACTEQDIKSAYRRGADRAEEGRQRQPRILRRHLYQDRRFRRGRPGAYSRLRGWLRGADQGHQRAESAGGRRGLQHHWRRRCLASGVA